MDEVKAERWVRGWYAADAALRRVRPKAARVAARSVASGLLLAVAREEQLVAIDEACYAQRRYGYHDGDEHNLRGLFDWEAAAVAAHFPPEGRLLVTSAGGGREVIALRRRGYDVVGVECHPALVARAGDLIGRLGLGEPVRRVPRDHCPVDPAGFDGVIVGWGAYTFLRGGAKRRAFLGELRQTLRPGAPALVSFFARRGRPRRFRLVAGIGQGLAAVLGGVGAEEGDVVDPTWQHYVSGEELAADVAAAGLRLEAWSEEGYAHAVLRRP